MRKLCYFINSDWYFDLHWIDRAIASRDAGYEIHIISHFIDDNIINKFKTFGFICHNVTLDAQSFNALVFVRTYHDVQKLLKYKTGSLALHHYQAMFDWWCAREEI